MRTIRIIEHISLDGVNSGPRWRERRPTLSLRRMGRGRMPTRMPERPSSRLMVRLSICCWAAALTIFLPAIGRKPRRVRWRTVLRGDEICRDPQAEESGMGPGRRPWSGHRRGHSPHQGQERAAPDRVGQLDADLSPARARACG